VLAERSGPVASLVLNRPDKHNALRFTDLTGSSPCCTGRGR
jgi:hypothetical protein